MTVGNSHVCASQVCSGNRKVFRSVPSRAMALSNSFFVNRDHFFMRAVKHLPLELADALEKAGLLYPAVPEACQTHFAEELDLVTSGDKEQGLVCVSGTVSSVFP